MSLRNNRKGFKFIIFDDFMDQEEVWNNIAPKWAEFRTAPVDEVKEFLEGKRGNVLDLGCGSGRNFIENDELKIYGVDFSEKFLELAKGRNCTELKKGTTDKIPYEKEFFDWVVFVRVLHCIEGGRAREKTLKEIYRVLKNGGEAVVSTIGWKNQRVKNKPKEGMLPWTIEEKKYERYNYIYELDELVKEVESVGFEVVKSWENMNVNLVVRKPIFS